MRSRSASTVDDNLLRQTRTIAPATLKRRSTLAEVPGMLRYFIARRRRVGKSSDKDKVKSRTLQNASGAGGSLVVGCDRCASTLQLHPCCCTQNWSAVSLWGCDAEEVNLAKMLSNTRTTATVPQVRYHEIWSQIAKRWIESPKVPIPNRIKSQIAWLQIESLMVKSNPVRRLNRDLNRIVIGICPSLSDIHVRKRFFRAYKFSVYSKLVPLTYLIQPTGRQQKMLYSMCRFGNPDSWADSCSGL